MHLGQGALVGGQQAVPQSNSTSRASQAGPAAVLGAAALWGTVGPAQVLFGSAADPGALGVMRLLLGGLILAVFCRRLSLWRRVLRRDVVGWVLVAALATGVYQVTFMHAVHQLGAAMGTSIALGVAPFATGLCARWWTGVRFTRGWICGTAAAALGCVVLLDPWGSSSPALTGVGVAVVSGTCYGIYTVAAKRFLDAGAPALATTAITLLIAGVALSPLVFLNPGHLLQLNSLLLMAWVGVAGTAAAYAAFIHGLRRTSAPTAGTLSLAEPLLAAALGFIVLREHVSVAAVIGCVILIGGLVTVSLGDLMRGRHLGNPAVPPRRRDARRDTSCLSRVDTVRPTH